MSDDFLVTWDCVRRPIQTSGVEGVSVMISESSATQFLVTITESTGTVRADETKHQR